MCGGSRGGSRADKGYQCRSVLGVSFLRRIAVILQHMGVLRMSVPSPYLAMHLCLLLPWLPLQPPPSAGRYALEDCRLD